MMSIQGDLQSHQIKHTPIDSVNELIILKNESVSHCRSQNQLIQICILICIMSSEIINLSVFNQIEKCRDG